MSPMPRTMFHPGTHSGARRESSRARVHVKSSSTRRCLLAIYTVSNDIMHLLLFLVYTNTNVHVQGVICYIVFITGVVLNIVTYMYIYALQNVLCVYS